MNEIPLTLNYDFRDYFCEVKKLEVPIILGKSNYGNIVVDFFKNPNLFITGETFSGKTNLLKVIITSLIEDTKPYDVYLCSFRQYEFFQLQDSLTIRQIVNDEENLISILYDLESNIYMRYDLMNKTKGDDFSYLIRDSVIKPIIFILDEYMFVYGNKTINNLINKIITLGKECYVYVIITAQRPDILPKPLYSNCSNIFTFHSYNQQTIFNRDKNLEVDGRGKYHNISGDILVVQTPKIVSKYIEDVV